MTYQTTITKKGQITIPKAFRDSLRLNTIQKVSVEMEHGGRSLRVRPTIDFLEVAKKITVKNPVKVMAGRKALERNYARK